MANLGRKYNCYSCHTKFYDMGKPAPTCPKCGADQREADEAPVYTSPRKSRVVEVPVIEEEFETEEAGPADTAEDEEEILVEQEEEPAADDEEEEEL
jgi:hypothetical protein